MGGKPVFVFCFLCTGLVTIGFSFAETVAGVGVAWLMSRAFQPCGRLGLIQLTGTWFHHAQLGTVMAVISAAKSVGRLPPSPFHSIRGCPSRAS